MAGKVAESLKSECRSIFGRCWSDDVAERFASVALSVADPGKVAVCGMASGLDVAQRASPDSNAGVSERLANQGDQIRVLMRRNDQLELENAELERLNSEQAEMLRVAGGVETFLRSRISELSAMAGLVAPGFADRAEAELIQRAFPANALKHSP